MAEKDSNGTTTTIPSTIAARSTEPSEDEPCMSTDDDKGRFEGNNHPWRRFERNACRKYDLDERAFRILFALAVIACLLALCVIVLGATWPRVPHSRSFPICKNEGCLRAAAQIQSSLNASLSPCTDLWHWACGGWLAKNPLPKDKSRWSLDEQLKYKETVRIRELISTLRLPLSTGTVEWKMKYLYEACMDVYTVNTNGATPLTNIINELGGWYITKNWNSADFDQKIIMTKLHLKYGVTPFFKIDVIRDPYARDTNTIRLSPTELGLPDRDYYYNTSDGESNAKVAKAYREMIRDVVINLGATTNEADKFATDLFFYEKRIAEILPNRYELDNPIDTSNHITISELKLIIPNIPFEDILAEIYPDFKSNDQTEVIVTSMKYFTQITQIITSTDRQTMNGYLMWTLTRTYLPYLSDNYVSTVTNYEQELFGISQSAERWETCSRLVGRFMSLATRVVAERANQIDKYTLNVTRTVFDKLLKIAKIRLEKFKQSPQFYRQLSNKLATIDLQIGLQSNLLKNESLLKDYYVELKIMKSNLFDSVKNCKIFEREIEEKLLLKNQDDYYYKTNIVDDIVYVPEKNRILLPARFLEEPYFAATYPDAVIYGRLGVKLGEALASALLPYGNLWTNDGKLLTQFHTTVNESLKSLDHLGCLKESLGDQMISADKSGAIALQNAKRLAAMDLAYRALLDSSNGKDHVHQPSLEEFEDPALFFLSYAQTQCSISTVQRNWFDIIVELTLPQQSSLNFYWTQLKDFQESFKCTYTEKYCMLLV